MSEKGIDPEMEMTTDRSAILTNRDLNLCRGKYVPVKEYLVQIQYHVVAEQYSRDSPANTGLRSGVRTSKSTAILYQISEE